MKLHLAYSSDWTDGNEYIMGTASEVHTNALFDIYPNDTTITAEFKGNTQQSGTPSPSAPVPVVGVGYLDGAAYKIPVEIGLSTQSIDLSAMQSIRNIGKYICTGNETWYKSETTFYIVPLFGYLKSSEVLTCISTHYPTTIQVAEVANVQDKTITFNYAQLPRLYISDSDFSTIDEFKTYLQQQYTNGTPVIIYYVLAESVTNIVNEPLQKIGAYADSISNITLTTTAGAKSFGVDTAVKPSEITLTFKGWHPKDPKESTGGEWG